MKCAVSCSLNKDSFSAGQNAARKILEQVPSPGAVLIFMTAQYEPEKVTEAVHQVLGSVELAGICTAGVIYGSTVHTRGVLLFAIEGEELFVQTSFHRKISGRGYAIGKEIGWKILNTRAGPGTVLLFPDGSSSQITELIEGLYDTLGPEYNYFGGGSGSSLNARAFQFSGEEADTNSVAAVFLSGVKTFSCLGHGWNPASEPVVITCSEEKRVYEIDGYPAYEAYKKRFPEIEQKKFAEFALYHPLGFPDIRGNYCLRDAEALHEDGSIEFLADIPNNSAGSFMECDLESLFENTELVARCVRKAFKQHRGILICSALSRYTLMREQYQKELESISKAFGRDIPLAGFLSSGEIGALNTIPFFLNKTLGILSAGE